MNTSLSLSLGPILYFWTKTELLDFYAKTLEMPVETIYLGEVVCSRRQEMRFDDWVGLAKDLESAGKKVILSSQVLLESESDLKRLRKFVEQNNFTIEANDMGAVKLAHEKKLPFIAGSTLNIYNEQALRLMQTLGAVRWVPPAEMDAEKVEELIELVPDLACEQFIWGAVPLAFSARCFTARYHNLKKDSCEFKCLEYPDALRLKTREDFSFLRINGIQILSDACQSLISYRDDFEKMGITMLRISPQQQNMAEIIDLHTAVLNNETSIEEAMVELRKLSIGELVDGYWRGTAGVSLQRGEDFARSYS